LQTCAWPTTGPGRHAALQEPLHSRFVLLLFAVSGNGSELRGLISYRFCAFRFTQQALGCAGRRVNHGRGSEEGGPVLPSGRTGGRRGETARQEDLVKGTHIPIVLHRTLLLRGEVVQIPVHGWRLALADPVRNGTVPSGLLRRAIGTATAAW